MIHNDIVRHLTSHIAVAMIIVDALQDLSNLTEHALPAKFTIGTLANIYVNISILYC